MPTYAALDGPYPYDLKINGTGYVLARGVEPSLPFRTQRAQYGYTPTFINRSNTSGQFGDNQQDFWLTSSQNDWSLGAGQRYFDPSDTEKARKYWNGTAIISHQAGEVTAQSTYASYAQGAQIVAMCGGVAVFNATATHLFQREIDQGAHGLAGAPICMTSDTDFVYLSDGTTVRTFNIGTPGFAAWSATGAQSLLYLNNTIYGTKNGVFYTYASAGAATASFTFKDGKGGTLAGSPGSSRFDAMKLAGLGGKVLVLIPAAADGNGQLWEWDGTGMSLLANFPSNFTPTGISVAMGIAFIVGLEYQTASVARTAVWFFENSTLDRTYFSPTWGSNAGNPGIAAYGNGFLFTDHIDQAVKYYDVTYGAVETVGTAPSTLDGNATFLATTLAYDVGFSSGGSSSLYIYDKSGANKTTGTLYTSLWDFNSSLQKLFRGVTVTFDNDTGCSVDIAYQVDSLTGAYTSLQTNATSGTEYTLPSNTIGKAISIKVTLNVSTTHTPRLTRVAVRAAPEQAQFRTGEYIIDLTSMGGQTATILDNGQPDPMTGREALDQLLTDVVSTTPFTVIDRLGTFTAVAELENLDIIEIKPEQFYVHFTVRQI